jgi:hypothetical protein
MLILRLRRRRLHRQPGQREVPEHFGQHTLGLAKDSIKKLRTLS